MQYRGADINDLQDLARLHAESWRGSYRGIFTDQFLDNDVWRERDLVWTERLTKPKPNQQVIVAYEGSKLCGFICAFGDESAQWGTFVDNLHVAKATQGKGVGKQLLHIIAQWANTLFEHKGLYLEVLEDNAKARHFYHKLGAKHQETNLWQPPGSDEHINDLLYVWDNHQALLAINDEKLNLYRS